MDIHRLHSWDLTPKDAIALQKELASRVEARTPLTRCRLIAGADVSYQRFGTIFYGGVVVLRADDLSIVEQQSVVRECKFPYVPGLLSFREAPVLLEAFARIRSEPDVILLDGQGFAHPRRFGLACHLGLWLDRPTIGCAKTLFVGKHGKIGEAPGSVKPLRDLARTPPTPPCKGGENSTPPCEGGENSTPPCKGGENSAPPSKGGEKTEEIVGMAVRTRLRSKPIYVSVGHRIDLASAVRVVLASGGGYRVPEPTRQAHLLVNAVRAGAACSLVGRPL